MFYTQIGISPERIELATMETRFTSILTFRQNVMRFEGLAMTTKKLHWMYQACLKFNWFSSKFPFSCQTPDEYPFQSLGLEKSITLSENIETQCHNLFPKRERGGEGVKCFPHKTLFSQSTLALPMTTPRPTSNRRDSQIQVPAYLHTSIGNFRHVLRTGPTGIVSHDVWLFVKPN